MANSNYLHDEGAQDGNEAERLDSNSGPIPSGIGLNQVQSKLSGIHYFNRGAQTERADVMLG
jgi:hypothetical protein